MYMKIIEGVKWTINKTKQPHSVYQIQNRAMTMRDEGGWNMQKRQLHRKQSILCLEKLGKIYVIYPERKASISFPETNSNFNFKYTPSKYRKKPTQRLLDMYMLHLNF